MKISLDDAAKIRAATISNIVKKIKSGGTPNAHETRLLEEATASQADGPDLRSLTCGVGDLAELFGLTEMRIQQLVKEGKVVKAERGKYLLWESVKGYVGFQQERAAGRFGGDGDVAPDSYEKHRARLYAARADAQEVLAARLKGQVHDSDAIASVINDMIARARSRFLAIPDRTAPILADIADPNECKARLTDAVHEALSELADYPAAEVVARQLKQEPPQAVADDMEPEPTEA